MALHNPEWNNHIKGIGTKAKQILDTATRAWYMAGQEWFDIAGIVDDECVEEMPETQRAPFLMGFNSAQWAYDHQEPQAVRGTVSRVTTPLAL